MFCKKLDITILEKIPAKSVCKLLMQPGHHPSWQEILHAKCHEGEAINEDWPRSPSFSMRQSNEPSVKTKP